MTDGAGSTIIRALEATWREAQDKHPDLPSAVFITGAGRKPTSITWGHWHPTRWHAYGAPKDVRAEVFVSGECLAQGAKHTLKTLLHEAAHGLAHARGIKDTSRGNRYHNRKFVLLAEEMGLTGPEAPETARGFSDCSLCEGTADTYETFPHLRQAILVVIGNAVETGPGNGPDGGETAKRKAPKFSCACIPARTVRLGVRSYEEGPIICGVCDGAFLEDLS